VVVRSLTRLLSLFPSRRLLRSNQRNTRVENKEIKAGRLPESWDKNPDRLRQKDLDSRWTKKNGISYYGYKNSICIDDDYALIRRYVDIILSYAAASLAALLC